MSDIICERNDRGGRYSLSLNGAEAELTWRNDGNGRIVADHTAVPDAMRGTGAGLALVKRMVVDAKAEGTRIVPQCPFVEAMRKRHPEWNDVFTL